jgi:hypothetical protein
MWMALMGLMLLSQAAEPGFTSMFDGKTFAGWKYTDASKGRWEIRDGVIALRADQPPRKGGVKAFDLWTEKSYGDVEMIVEWRLTMTPVQKEMPDFTPDGLYKKDAAGKMLKHTISFFGDSGIYFRGDGRWQVNFWSQPMGSGDINEVHKDAKIPAEIRTALMPKVHADNPPGQWNQFRITMKGDRVTVILNGKLVIDNAQIPGMPPTGPIALQNHGDPVEFRNLQIREIK